MGLAVGFQTKLLTDGLVVEVWGVGYCLHWTFIKASMLFGQ